ncbi:hypothetical protein MKW94_015308 [Papaver nudicaule]|uniref:Uncharacterized protein n=1 Tax=Papaver nudicaule TaxID=74823 RepID=A0AA42B474_PAPNU|nr:hypothetical protein [Papaver nudicaule]
MAKGSSLLVINLFVVVFVVLQFAYVSGEGTKGGGYVDQVRECNAGELPTQLDEFSQGGYTSCNMCDDFCVKSVKSQGQLTTTTICVSDPANKGEYICKCCIPYEHLKDDASGKAATTTTSLCFLSFSLFLSLTLN